MGRISKRFIPLAGIAIFVFGNRKNKTTGVLEEATGVIDEFNIAFENGLLLIPIGATGFVSKCLWDQIIASFKDSFLIMNIYLTISNYLVILLLITQ
ncbi:hypothetical protein K7J14_00025 [Treponema zuelzerae]|uniref:NAD(+) hydrolase ThsA Sir2/TIR-associating SLOG domain-containing protein n=1 Tax=Teretinema zuelzerae TaxID=156 RepID=A0AAE3JHL5_9SPIR|nr:hypothetical protein [Teretinema zuelzerae]